MRRISRSQQNTHTASKTNKWKYFERTIMGGSEQESSKHNPSGGLYSSRKIAVNSQLSWSKMHEKYFW
jgi:hypothetical protein